MKSSFLVLLHVWTLMQQVSTDEIETKLDRRMPMISFGNYGSGQMPTFSGAAPGNAQIQQPASLSAPGGLFSGTSSPGMGGQPGAPGNTVAPGVTNNPSGNMFPFSLLSGPGGLAGMSPPLALLSSLLGFNQQTIQPPMVAPATPPPPVVSPSGMSGFNQQPLAPTAAPTQPATPAGMSGLSPPPPPPSPTTTPTPPPPKAAQTAGGQSTPGGFSGINPQSTTPTLAPQSDTVPQPNAAPQQDAPSQPDATPQPATAAPTKSPQAPAETPPPPAATTTQKPSTAASGFSGSGSQSSAPSLSAPFPDVSQKSNNIESPNSKE